MVILGVLGAIGYGVYTNFIRDARDTALDLNIQTAASELQSALALESTLTGPDLLNAMASRTTFYWSNTWALAASRNEPTTVRLEFLTHAEPTGNADTDSVTAKAVAGTAPTVGWGLNANSAIRIQLANSDNEWRCALVVLRPSAANIANLDGSGGIDDAVGKRKAAQMRGIWYDGGSVIDTTNPGLHNCSPVSVEAALTWSATGPATCTSPSTGTSPTAICLPADAQSWQIYADGEHDTTSSSVNNYRTLHRTTSSLDGS